MNIIILNVTYDSMWFADPLHLTSVQLYYKYMQHVHKMDKKYKKTILIIVVYWILHVPHKSQIQKNVLNAFNAFCTKEQSYRSPNKLIPLQGQFGYYWHGKEYVSILLYFSWERSTFFRMLTILIMLRVDSNMVQFEKLSHMLANWHIIFLKWRVKKFSIITCFESSIEYFHWTRRMINHLICFSDLNVAFLLWIKVNWVPLFQFLKFSGQLNLNSLLFKIHFKYDKVYNIYKSHLQQSFKIFRK